MDKAKVKLKFFKFNLRFSHGVVLNTIPRPELVTYIPVELRKPVGIGASLNMTGPSGSFNWGRERSFSAKQPVYFSTGKGRNTASWRYLLFPGLKSLDYLPYGEAIVEVPKKGTEELWCRTTFEFYLGKKSQTSRPENKIKWFYLRFPEEVLDSDFA